MKKTHRTSIAKDTLEIIERGFYKKPDGSVVSIANQMSRALAGTRLYRPDDFPEEITPSGASDKTIVEVTGETALEATARLIREKSLATLCLNFASAKNPGGGFLKGSQAQEESLARSSGLYPTLLRMREMYDYHRTQETCLYSDHMIYSPDVPVFRNDDGDLLDAPYPVTFLTSPAVNAGVVLQNEPENAGRIREVMARRIHRVLWVAREHGHRTLVLGAWGCGVFRNDPGMIAELFDEALRPGGIFHGDFTHIVHPVYDTSSERNIFNAFDSILSAGAWNTPA